MAKRKVCTDPEPEVLAAFGRYAGCWVISGGPAPRGLASQAPASLAFLTGHVAHAVRAG